MCGLVFMMATQNVWVKFVNILPRDVQVITDSDKESVEFGSAGSKVARLIF